MAAETCPLKPDCSQVVKDCNKVITAAKKTIADQQAEIDLYSTQVKVQDTEIVNLNAALTEAQNVEAAWYHNPWLVGALGILVGGLTVAIVKK